MNAFVLLMDRIIYLYVWILIINAVLSWLVAFNVLNTQNRFVFSALEITYKLTDPPLNYIRRFLPRLGSIDISPVILILLIYFVRDLISDIFRYLS
jgi:YggT family protein|tara:strand:+ start:231 stop:518 length:288 start_codon:yes stop_codon:yes gene_type:complete